MPQEIREFLDLKGEEYFQLNTKINFQLNTKIKGNKRIICLNLVDMVEE